MKLDGDIILPRKDHSINSFGKYLFIYGGDCENKIIENEIYRINLSNKYNS